MTQVLVTRRILPALLLWSLMMASASAQQKSARAYYQEAESAHALPSLPYVCFRSSAEMSFAPGNEVPYNDPTFAMLGTTAQVAEVIKAQSPAKMSASDREELDQLRHRDSLVMEGFDHGINGGMQFFDRNDASDPARAEWVFKGTFGSQGKPVTWDLNINWGTLRFRERITIESDSMTYYGRCEPAGN